MIDYRAPSADQFDGISEVIAVVEVEINFIEEGDCSIYKIRKSSVRGSEAIWRLQFRVDLELQSDLEAGVRCIWQLFNLKLLQIGKRVKFTRHTIYNS